MKHTAKPITAERLRAAHRACIAASGPRKGKLKRQSPRAGTDASAMWQAMMLEVNPHRVGMGHMLANAWQDDKFARTCCLYAKRWHEAHAPTNGEIS